MKKVIILFIMLLSINLFSQQESEINKTKFYWGITLGLPNDLNPVICLKRRIMEFVYQEEFGSTENMGHN